MSSDDVSYFNPETMVSILVPRAWDGEQVSDQQFRFYAPPAAELNDHRPSISYQRSQMNQRGEAPFMALADKYLNNMKNGMAQFQLLGEVAFRLSSGGAPVIVRDFSWVDEDDTNHIFRQFQAFILYRGQTVYVVNAAARPLAANDIIPTFKAVLHSTRIIPPA